nr:MAG TPA: hypothetical protein [Caudoviricetes sp.]
MRSRVVLIAIATFAALLTESSVYNVLKGVYP